MFRGWFTLLITGCALATVPAFAVVERRVERRFDVSETAVLNVDVFSGEVRITSVPDARFIEVGVLEAANVGSDAEMEDRLASLSMAMSQQGDTVSVTARYAKPVAWTWKSWPPVNLIFEIKVPRRCDVRVTTGEGAITIGSLEGRVMLANNTGNIFVGEIDGPVTVRSQRGEVAVTAATGAIDVSTSVSGITIGRALGGARLSSQGGFIEVQTASGELVIHGNGSSAKVGFAAEIRQPAEIVVSGGEIMLALENSSRCTLDLKSSFFGKVALRGALPLEVTSGGVGRSSLGATVNGGGARITARAGGGSVEVRGLKPLFTALPARSGN